MLTRLRRTALPVALVVLSLAAAPAAVAAPVTVNLRVEVIADTIFDGQVVTDAHQTTTPSDGVARPCDGTNNGGAPTPTAIGALDDGSAGGGFASHEERNADDPSLPTTAISAEEPFSIT